MTSHTSHSVLIDAVSHSKTFYDFMHMYGLSQTGHSLLDLVLESLQQSFLPSYPWSLNRMFSWLWMTHPRSLIDNLTLWRFDGLTVWRFDGLTVWRFDGLTLWHSDTLTTWQAVTYQCTNICGCASLMYISGALLAKKNENILYSLYLPR